jgi:hypothetical protein
MSGADHEVPHYAVFSSPLAINPFTVETSVALIKKIYIFLLPDLAQGAASFAVRQRRLLHGEDSDDEKYSLYFV